MYNNEIIPNRDIEKRRNKLIPETKINIIQLNIINKVCPRSGCRISSNTIDEVNKKDIKNFIQRVEFNKNKCLNFLKRCKNNGKTVFIYGASTKGNTLLQYYGIDNKMIKYASERSPEKWGKFTIGTGLEIVSEAKARKLNPDYFFVMPYGFIKEFIKREKPWLKQGGKFILPYPNFKIVK